MTHRNPIDHHNQAMPASATAMLLPWRPAIPEPHEVRRARRRRIRLTGLPRIVGRAGTTREVSA
jgi:hypothetical protein